MNILRNLTGRLRNNFGKFSLACLAFMAGVFIYGGFFQDMMSAQAYEYECEDVSPPLTTIEKVIGVTAEGEKVFVGRGIVGDGTGLNGSANLAQIPQCTSDDPLFQQEGNLLITLEETGETVYLLNGVVAFLGDSSPLEK